MLWNPSKCIILKLKKSISKNIAKTSSLFFISNNILKINHFNIKTSTSRPHQSKTIMVAQLEVNLQI